MSGFEVVSGGWPHRCPFKDAKSAKTIFFFYQNKQETEPCVR